MQQPPLVGTWHRPSSVPPQPALSRSMTVLLVGIALLMMSSGVALIYDTAVAHPAQLRVQATATVQTFLTTEVQGTATANVQATATTLAHAKATATMQAHVQATASTLQSIYMKATS